VLYRWVAAAEALTWTLLLAGMVLKYVLRVTDLGVSVAGVLHGFAFLVFCLATIVVAVDQRWSARQVGLGLISAVPPLATVAFQRWVERRRPLADTWRLRTAAGAGLAERAVAVALRRPAVAGVVAAVLVTVVFVALMAVGPPTQLIAGR